MLGLNKKIHKIMITPSVSIHVDEIKTEEGISSNTPSKYLYKSCCLLIDKRFAEFMVKLLVVLSVIGFSLYKLNSLEECDKQQPYLALLTLLIGLVFPVIESITKTP